MAKKSFRTAVLLKREVTYGVDPTPAGATDAVLIRNATITPLDLLTEDRALVKYYFGENEKIVVGQTVKIDYEVEMAASGTLGTAPAWAMSTRICGFSETIAALASASYVPVSSGWESGAFYFNRDGILHVALGARGSKKMVLKAGSVPVIQYSMLALYSAPADVGFPSQVFTAWKKPVAVNNANTTAFALHGYAGVLANLSIDVATSPTYKNLVGVERSDLEASAITGQITLELPTIAAKDFFAICKSGALGALTVTHGPVVANKVKFDSTTVQLRNPVYSDGAGDVHLTMDMTFVQLVTGEAPLIITCI